MKFKSLFLSCTMIFGFSSVSSGADDAIRVGTPSVTLYSFSNQSGRSLVLNRDTPKLKKMNFSGNAMSMTVSGGQWEVCDTNQYNGQCEVFGPGQYNFGIFNWGNKIKSVRRVRSNTPTITLYARENMKGENHTYARSVPRIKDIATNDFAHSVKINGGEWVLCADSGGKGKCETVRRDMPNLRSIGLAGSISSLYRARKWNNGLDGSDDHAGGGSYAGGGYAGGGSGYGADDGRYNGGRNGSDDRRYGDDRRYNNREPQIVLFEGYNFNGPRITVDTETSSLLNSGFSNRASSVRILSGTWELCDGTGFTKTCREVSRDERDLSRIGLDSVITSVRPLMIGRPVDDRNGPNTRGFEGQRTVFFGEPTVSGTPVASCLYRNSQCGREAANAYCRSVGLGNAVYFDQARSYRAPYILGERRVATRSSQQRLIDVLCRR